MNNAAWYSVYAANGAYKGPAPISSFISGQGIAQGLVLPQNFTNDTNGYVSPGDVSAYVHDWANGSTFTNYAFYNAPTTSVPEPESMPLIGLGLLGLVLARRKTQKA
ncbi:PEP-CTERM sorting domain-containing protein [Undibacterium sp. SXout20W]|uniref:PEP-CTERM sorting domain-containing protein n=1 Tax=Undibacterium sp. SXout20W TaxID=3413051 RepID=UPI003BF0FC28